MEKQLKVYGVDINVEIPQQLASFEIRHMDSSHVDFFGLNKASQFLVQFKNGKAFVYDDISNMDIIEIINCASIGKLLANVIKPKYQGRQIDQEIKIIPTGSGLMAVEAPTKQNKFYAKKGDVVDIVSENNGFLLLRNDKRDLFIQLSKKVLKSAIK